jgi:hypothetical protein
MEESRHACQGGQTLVELWKEDKERTNGAGHILEHKWEMQWPEQWTGDSSPSSNWSMLHKLVTDPLTLCSLIFQKRQMFSLLCEIAC